MTGNIVVTVETLYYLLSRLESLPESLLLLQHLVLVTPLLLLYYIQPLPDHIVQILGLLVDRPPVLDLLRLKPEHIVLEQDVHLRVPVHLRPHLLYLGSHRTVQKVLQLTRLLNVNRLTLNLTLNLPETLQLLYRGSNHPLRDSLDETLTNSVVLVRHIIANLFSVDVEHTDLDTLYNLVMDLLLPLTILLNLILNLFYLFRFVLLYPLQLLLHVQQKKLLVLRVLGKVGEERVSNRSQVALELVEQLPNP
jgi:hypothetical protein